VPFGSNQYHAFSWTEKDGMVDLGTLGGTLSSAVAVNDRGALFGYSSTMGNAEQHAVLWLTSRTQPPPRSEHSVLGEHGRARVQSRHSAVR
jgi:uncharacterized membrane protein